ncbi:hypothetical protein LEP1GSC061_2133 [Leptospira wolffii serovar Khorat str. Khorat-H2]|nr:hypothetical protein LEP1GSC061_2133 [Leptospira wolffii serovar Khorat str. Khorat-H2]
MFTLFLKRGSSFQASLRGPRISMNRLWRRVKGLEKIFLRSKVRSSRPGYFSVSVQIAFPDTL